MSRKTQIQSAWKCPEHAPRLRRAEEAATPELPGLFVEEPPPAASWTPAVPIHPDEDDDDYRDRTGYVRRRS